MKNASIVCADKVTLWKGRVLGFKKLIGIADFFICVFDLALKKEFLPITIVDQSGARSPKTADVEP